ncbi:DUF2927 domain-containing protein [Rhodobacteraceae bacterium XHP0102]|nr:DUF2927 domain-containing protein [Rhodobacteraceae bacterium XHP0102]
MIVLLGALTACAPAAPLENRAENTVARLQPSLAQTPVPLPSFGPYTPQPLTRSNQSLADDFMALSFVLESGRQIPRISRFEGPITVAVAPSSPAIVRHELDRLIARLRNEARIDIRVTAFDPNRPANITVNALPAAQIDAAVPQAACFVVPNARTWQDFIRQRGRVSTDWASLTTRSSVAIFLPNDTSPQEMRDCLHEELGQALGPLNDLYDLTDSVFNDDNFHAVLTAADMAFLRLFNDPALQSGMGQAEVAAQLPAILARINPNGGAVTTINLSNRDNRAWRNAISRALRRDLTEGQRMAQAQMAVEIAQTAGISDARLGFSHYVLARLSLRQDPVQASAAIEAAEAIYARLPHTEVQRASLALQRGTLALQRGQTAAALGQSRRALPIARQVENANLLANLLMLKATALAAEGRMAEAEISRLDAYAWGRYGFADQTTMLARLGDIATLAPQNDLAPRN